MEQSNHKYQEAELNDYTQKLADLDLIQGEQVEPWAGISAVRRGRRDHANCQNAKSYRDQHKMLGSKIWQAVNDKQVSGEDNCNRRQRNEQPFADVALADR